MNEKKKIFYVERRERQKKVDLKKQGGNENSKHTVSPCLVCRLWIAKKKQVGPQRGLQWVF